MLWLVSVLIMQAPATPAPAFEKTARQAAVRIYNSDTDSGGSGVVIGRSGESVYILTAAHVVDKAKRVEIQVVDVDDPAVPTRYLNADVIASSKTLVQDLAVVRLKAKREVLPAAVRVRTGTAPAVKDLTGIQSVACGTSRRPIAALEPETIVDARKVRKSGADEAALFWRCRERPAVGRSGGALLDAAGRLIGVCSGEDGKLGYYTHLDEIQRFLKSNALSFLAE